ncbi:P42251, related [Eimeria brunetti]|uniref:p42251, related n=1 Tax=Eimeria brunetti TaxID=51314 RepID=U6LLZ3_9EIME|nr:P42251, related [Eimeria brunetti]
MSRSHLGIACSLFAREQQEGLSGLDAKHDIEGRRVWEHIGRRKPQAFLWMGDNVYADHMQLPTASDSRNFLWRLSEGKKPIPPAGLVAAYNSQLANVEYRAFVEEVPNIAGTWDDHDMGEDNANKLYTFKYESKETMLNFLGVDEAAAIRSVDWKGVYSSHEIYMGEDLNVKMIFLDLRFEKDSWWLMDMGDMLGEQQWAWLQQELQFSTADVNIVVSSLQTFANHRQGAASLVSRSKEHVWSMHCQRLPEDWCLNEPEVRSYLTAFHNRSTGNLTPHQQLLRLADLDGEEPSLQVESGQMEAKPTVFAPRQDWRRPLAPAYRGAFPPPPFAADQPQQDGLLREDQSSLYLFDMTSSGLGHGVPESMCRAAPAMVELAAYFLTEGIPFASSLNADNTGPRLLYTERNFGELEFIENPLQLVLFPSTNDHPRNESRRQEYQQLLSEDNAASRVQLFRVMEKSEAIRQLHRQLQQKRPLHLHRQLTRSQASKFRIRLQAYKKQREHLVKELTSKPTQRPAIVERIVGLSREFEIYTQTVFGSSAIIFSRLLQLHSALLLIHACEDEGVRHSGVRSSSRSNLLFTSCSLLTPWESISRPPAAGSFVDATLRWLWDRVFGLTSRRQAFNNAFPFGDAAALRLSAAVDQLARMAATARAVGIARLAESRRLLPSKFIRIRLRGPESSRRFRAKGNGTGRRQLLLGVFSAASDSLLRQACLQLQSPRRQQQREEIDQLFQRGVANQPADPFVFADLGPELQLVCSLIDIPGEKRQGSVPLTRPAAPGFLHFAANHVANAVADSWVLVEVLETKTWILSRTFDAVTGRLAKEKLLSSFASEQRHHQPGIGQWTCQGWKGPSERRMYICHLCILGASLLALGAIIVIIIAILFLSFKAASLVVATLGKLWRSGSGISSKRACGNPTGQHTKPSLRHKVLTLKLVALAGVIMAMKPGAVVSEPVA